jgi:hypothetical protein
VLQLASVFTVCLPDRCIEDGSHGNRAIESKSLHATS